MKLAKRRARRGGKPGFIFVGYDEMCGVADNMQRLMHRAFGTPIEDNHRRLIARLRIGASIRLGLPRRRP
jgi:hypothetical protein